MKLRHALIIMVIVILGLSPLASASGAVVFFDNFNTENGGVGQLNYYDFANWTVARGSVDLIGTGYYDLLPGNGLYVDLDGSTNQAGILETKTTFGPGQYAVSFDLAGSQRDIYDTVTVSFGSLLQTITLGSSIPFTPYTYNVTLTAPAQLVFNEWPYYNNYNNGVGGTDVGLWLDNVKVQTVPLPPSLLLLGSGLAGLGLLRRKWSLKK